MWIGGSEVIYDAGVLALWPVSTHQHFRFENFRLHARSGGCVALHPSIINLVEAIVISDDVGEPYRDLQDIVDAAASSRQRQIDVGQRRNGLPSNVADGQLLMALTFKSNLARSEDDVTKRQRVAESMRGPRVWSGRRVESLDGLRAQETCDQAEHRVRSGACEPGVFLFVLKTGFRECASHECTSRESATAAKRRGRR